MKDSAQSKDGMSKDGAKNAQSRDSMSRDGTKDSAQSRDGMSKDGAKNACSQRTACPRTPRRTARSPGMARRARAAPPRPTASPRPPPATPRPRRPLRSPPEKRTQIVSAIKSETSIKETTNVNFNISVGTRVPSSVTFYPLPPRIVEIYPEWRGYKVILVKDRYVIVRPETYEIVYVIEA